MHESSEMTSDKQQILSLYPRCCTYPDYIDDGIDVRDNLLEADIPRIFALVVGVCRETFVVTTCDKEKSIVDVVDQGVLLR